MAQPIHEAPKSTSENVPVVKSRHCDFPTPHCNVNIDANPIDKIFDKNVGNKEPAKDYRPINMNLVNLIKTNKNATCGYGSIVSLIAVFV